MAVSKHGENEEAFFCRLVEAQDCKEEVPMPSYTKPMVCPATRWLVKSPTSFAYVKQE